MKSISVSVALPAWTWTLEPSKKFLFASYALSLSIRDSVKCRRLIESPWYKSYFGEMFELHQTKTKSKDLKMIRQA